MSRANTPCGPDWVPPPFRNLMTQGAAGADFRPACRQHDQCYAKGTCVPKEQCDREFLDNALRACDQSWWPNHCRRKAHFMSWLIETFGASSYGT